MPLAELHHEKDGERDEGVVVGGARHPSAAPPRPRPWRVGDEEDLDEGGVLAGLEAEAAEMQAADAADAAEMQPRCSRGAAEMQPRRTAEIQPRDAADVQPRDAAERDSRERQPRDAAEVVWSRDTFSRRAAACTLGRAHIGAFKCPWTRRPSTPMCLSFARARRTGVAPDRRRGATRDGRPSRHAPPHRCRSRGEITAVQGDAGPVTVAPRPASEESDGAL